MSDDTTIYINTKGLDALLKAFKNVPTARVGILGSKGGARVQEQAARKALKETKQFKTANPEGRKELLSDVKAAYASGNGVRNNAEIGAKHEFGEDGMPQRSFLRVPLIDHLNKYIESSGLFSKQVLQQVIAERSIRAWVQNIGLVAETVIGEAFDSGGFGKWKPSNMKYKKVHQTLVETQQLRNSITSEVK